MSTEVKSKLALLGGEKCVKTDVSDMFDWPIVTKEDEDAVVEVIRNRKMSGLDVTEKFEAEYAAWCGSKYAISAPNGTSSIKEGMFAVGIGVGDEIIVPSLTFWASILQVYDLGGTCVFAEVDPSTLCIDPDDIEHRITDHTKAILVVHYTGYPCDMDRIMAIAKKHNLKVIEDNSHGHGAMYKGKMLGSIGDVGVMSMMTVKSFAIGEAGMLVTDDRQVYERAVMFGHYIRQNDEGLITDPELQKLIGLPLGGMKNRLNQTVAAMGRVQLKHFPKRIAQIDKAMNYFCDLLDSVPGIGMHRPAKDSGLTKGGWYCPAAHYVPEELGGLSISRFCEAVRAEGVGLCLPGLNKPLHTHPLFNTADIHGHGKPTRIANSDRDLRQPEGSLPVTEKVAGRVFMIPWFKHYRPEIIEEHAAAFKKVCENYNDLLEGDTDGDKFVAGWSTSHRGNL